MVVGHPITNQQHAHAFPLAIKQKRDSPLKTDFHVHNAAYINEFSSRFYIYFLVPRLVSFSVFLSEKMYFFGDGEKCSTFSFTRPGKRMMSFGASGTEKVPRSSL